MIRGVCKICNGQTGDPVLDVSACADTYLDHLGITYRDRPRRYLRCRACRLIFRDPMLSPQEKNRLYEHFRDPSLRRETGHDYFKRITELPEEESENHEKCRYLENFIPETGKLLDIGAGYGVFIYQYQKFFPRWQGIGVEPTQGVAEIARSYGVSLQETYLTDETRKTLGDDFDLITVNHVLEHLDRPAEFLRLAASYLAKNGLLYIEVPSAADIGYLDKTHDRFMCQHEVIFDDEVLANLLDTNGLEIVAMQHFLSKRKRNNLRVICRSAASPPRK